MTAQEVPAEDTEEEVVGSIMAIREHAPAVAAWAKEMILLGMEVTVLKAMFQDENNQLVPGIVGKAF